MHVRFFDNCFDETKKKNCNSICLCCIESFGQNYPEEFDGSLDCISLAVTCAFNKYGTLLAVGCNDGRIVIWDFLTRGIAKIISAHVHPVCSISWSRSGHKVWAR